MLASKCSGWPYGLDGRTSAVAEGHWIRLAIESEKDHRVDILVTPAMKADLSLMTAVTRGVGAVEPPVVHLAPHRPRVGRRRRGRGARLFRGK